MVIHKSIFCLSLANENGHSKSSSFGTMSFKVYHCLQSPVMRFFPPSLSQMDMRYDIDDEDEELTFEDFLDKKMRDWELSQVESIYSLACNCLLERKNRRPVIKQVQ